MSSLNPNDPVPSSSSASSTRSGAPRSTPEPPPAGTRMMRFGSAVGVALLASVLSSGPAAHRIAQVTDARGAWPALCAVTLLPMVLAVLTLRQARVGLSVLAGVNGPPARSYSLGLWIASFSFTLLVLGALLRDKTHHHPLAGATFALFSATAGVMLVPVCRRVSNLLADLADRGRTLKLAGLGLALASLGLFAFVVFMRLLPPGGKGVSLAASANVIDILAFSIAALLASRPELGERRILALFGPPMAATVFAVGLRYLMATAPLASAIAEYAPSFAPVVEVLVPRS